MNVKFRGNNPQYIGDGVYASWDGYLIWLETSHGITITNRVALEPSVFVNLLEYKAWLDRELKNKVAENNEGE